MKMYSRCKLVVLIMLCATGCGSEGFDGDASNQQDHYSMEDFHLVEKVDAHVHANSANVAFVDQARQDKFRLISINVDYPDFPPIDEQFSIALKLSQMDDKNFMFAATFSVEGFGQPQWQSEVVSRIDDAVGKGALAVKVWKNIGMDFRNRQGNLVMIDNDGFDPVFAHLKSINIPLIGHQGEPKNCWLPLDQMTVNNDRQYFAAHPQYHMHLHPQFPSYEDQMNARDTMLKKNVGLPFMGAHMASLEWSVDELAKFLDRFPLAVVDMAARMGQVQHQSQLDREKVRQFFIDYQDRVLYATDLTHSDAVEADDFRQQVHKKWLDDWAYLNTEKSITVPEVNGEVAGLSLPKTVIDKIYRLNALGFFNVE